MDILVFMEILLIGLSLGHIKIWNHNLMEGSVYVLTNPAMPNMVKIGKTTRDVELRLADLYSTGVPLPFECEYAAKVKDVDKTEIEKSYKVCFLYSWYSDLK